MPNARHFKTTAKWHCLNCQNFKSTGKQKQTGAKKGANSSSTATTASPAPAKKRKLQAIVEANDTNSDIDSIKSNGGGQKASNSKSNGHKSNGHQTQTMNG
jgi:hypothetical protein